MSDTQGVLDMMTAGIVGRKDAKAVLTPVGHEKHGPLDGKHDVAFPYDDPQTVRDALRHGIKLVSDTKAELDHVGKGLVALAQLYGLSEEEAVADNAPVRVDAQKVREREADARVAATFAEDFAAKSEAAQEATFKPFAEPKPEVVSGDAAAEGWQCPTHGDASLTQLTSRKGRKYRACVECSEFEK